MNYQAQRTIRLKAYLGLTQLIVVIGLAFFLSAGTFKYWQAWTYLLLFGGSSLLVTIYLMRRDMELLKRRLTAGPTGEQRGIQKVIQVFASISFLVVLIAPGLDQRYSWTSVPLVLVVCADVFVVAGFYIVFLVFRENTYTSAVIETEPAQSVVSTGPYSVVRHPMYSGALLMLLFTPLALGSFSALIFFIPMLVVIIVRLLDEEKYLRVNLSGYSDYLHKVRYRLIPGVW